MNIDESMEDAVIKAQSAFGDTYPRLNLACVLIPGLIDEILAVARKAAADEREACAQEIESISSFSDADIYKECAAAIRARKD